MDKLYLFRCLLLLPSVVLALPQATTPTAATSIHTGPAFPTMAAQDGVGVPDGGVGSIEHPTAAAGADGSNQGAFSLSTGAIIGISVAIGLVIVAIATMWALWYLAKKRQWNVRESIRRASRRITGRKVPPKSAQENKSRRGTAYVNKSTSNSRARDVERVMERSQQPLRPTHGWLADEKERSRSRSREDEERLHKAAQHTSRAIPGWKPKAPFGVR
ncbi:hypothetical protein E2P81_ATG10084 [Venturia nashicola]|uniref:Transmembrane protein n=1 Tax=Venturia nashicola TaxID=86259 RepID=A0A4Z1NRQ7_9PEZI|nr:hypothetical protein E6O75_ATG10304 [Venturia nashicola]TLD18262.1 hypothetical protein E2P81_ATG10084 [Venturia nashicola]